MFFKYLLDKTGSYWIKNPAIGFRRITTVYLFILLLLLILFSFGQYLAFSLVLVFYLFLTLFFAERILNKGYVHRLERFCSMGKNIEVLDHFFPKDKTKNRRSLSLVGDDIGDYSYINLNIQNNLEEGSFDYCRVLAKLLLEDISHALVLGGGGASIPVSIARNYPQSRIDVVEIDPKIIQVAKKYFIPNREINKRITFLNKDVFIFTKENHKKYDFVFSDIFIGSDIPTKALDSNFLKQTKRTLSDKGLLIINAGYKNCRLAGQLIEKCNEVFSRTYIFIVKRNIIIVALDNYSDKTNIFYSKEKLNNHLINEAEKVLHNSLFMRFNDKKIVKAKTNS